MAEKTRKCGYCDGVGYQFEAMTMDKERCLYCGGTGRMPVEWHRRESIPQEGKNNG